MLLINCPECQAQFRVPPSAVPPQGRTLRCSSCAHAWYYTDPLQAVLAEMPSSAVMAADAPSFLQHPTSDASFADVMQQTAGKSLARPKTPFRPKGAEKRPFWHLDRAGGCGYLAAALVGGVMMWGLASFQATVTTILPRAQAAYDVFGMKMVLRSSDLAFEDTDMAFQDGKLSIKGAVRNLGTAQKSLRPVRAALMSAARPEPLKIWVFRLDPAYINPEQIIPFEITRDFEQGDQVTKVQLTFMTDGE